MDNINMQSIVDKKNLLIAVAIIILLVVLVTAGYFYWNWSTGTKTAVPTAEDITDSATQGVLPSIQTNALENKPNVNPVDVANPYKDIKTNPF